MKKADRPFERRPSKDDLRKKEDLLTRKKSSDDLPKPAA